MALMTCGELHTIEVTKDKIKDLRSVGSVPVLYIQNNGKTSKSNFVKITPQVETAIRAYLKLHDKN